MESVSSPDSDEDGGSAGDGSNTTPATSAALTPVNPGTKPSSKRVSASARAKELKSSTFALNNGRSRSSNSSGQRGVKRDSSAVVKNEDSTDVDAALASAMQLEEYQSPSKKKRKPVATTERETIDLVDSDDEYDPKGGAQKKAKADYESSDYNDSDRDSWDSDLGLFRLFDSDFDSDDSDFRMPLERGALTVSNRGGLANRGSANRGGLANRGGRANRWAPGRRTAYDNMMDGITRRVCLRFFFFFFFGSPVDSSL